MAGPSLRRYGRPSKCGPRARGLSASVRRGETLLLFAAAPTAGALTSRLAIERGEALARSLATGFLLDIADTCGRWRAQQLGADLNRRVVLYVSHGLDHPTIV